MFTIAQCCIVFEIQVFEIRIRNTFNVFCVLYFACSIEVFCISNTDVMYFMYFKYFNPPKYFSPMKPSAYQSINQSKHISIAPYVAIAVQSFVLSFLFGTSRLLVAPLVCSPELVLACSRKQHSHH